MNSRLTHLIPILFLLIVVPLFLDKEKDTNINMKTNNEDIVNVEPQSPSPTSESTNTIPKKPTSPKGGNDEHVEEEDEEDKEVKQNPNQIDEVLVYNSEPVSNLKLPFKMADVLSSKGGINPAGVVRTSKDEGSIGHSGIDVPLREGAEILAVESGKVVQIVTAGDPWGGKGVYQLLKETADGEGWGYIYEHIIPRSGLKVGDTLLKGEVLGSKAAPDEFTAHFQYSFLFSNHRYTRDNKCWSEYLSSTDSQEFLDWWNVYKNSEHLLGSWQSIFEDGAYPFRGLLNEEKFPNGLQLCYPWGTDVR